MFAIVNQNRRIDWTKTQFSPLPTPCESQCSFKLRRARCTQYPAIEDACRLGSTIRITTPNLEQSPSGSYSPWQKNRVLKDRANRKSRMTEQSKSQRRSKNRILHHTLFFSLPLRPPNCVGPLHLYGKDFFFFFLKMLSFLIPKTLRFFLP